MSEKGKEKPERRELSEQQQRMASAWLDQELPEAERDVIESALIDGDEALRREIESYREVRHEFRSWFEKEIGTASRDVQLWSGIARRIAADTRPSKESWSERFLGAMQALLLRPAFAGGVAAFAAALLVISMQGRNPGAPQELAMKGAPAAGVVADEELQLRLDSRLQLGERDALMIEALDAGKAPADGSLLAAEQPVGSDLLTTVGFDDLRRSLPRKLPVPDSLAVKLLSSPQLILDDNIPGGLRAGDADIEWIKSERPIRLVSTRRAQTPPIVWVRSR